MSLRKRLRVVFVCVFLQFGTLVGVPMRPEEIQDLMRQMSAPKLAHVLPSEEDDGDPPPPPTAGGAKNGAAAEPAGDAHRAGRLSQTRPAARFMGQMLNALRRRLAVLRLLPRVRAWTGGD